MYSRFVVGVMVAFAVVACGKKGEQAAPAVAVVVKSDATRPVDGGVTLREVVLDRGGAAMSVWIYRPATPAQAKRPVVLIAPAGSPMMWGMALHDGDRPEHLPWVERGYTVVAYSLDGAVPAPPTEATAREGIRQFLRAQAGLDNARAALDFALAHEPGVDPARVFAVGHSSAATLALRVGVEDARVKAVVAFAPGTDVLRHVAQALSTIDAIDPDGRKILGASSPVTFAAALRGKPVFLFHADDDRVVPTADVQGLFDAMRPAHAASKLVTVPTGDHYDSMLHAGIPAAADWLAHL
jgi:dipeptidyl aminopeptidase/acylaminoacyl peptidase